MVLLLLFSQTSFLSGNACGQTSNHGRLTSGLNLQEIEPGIEYGQVSSGQSSNGELKGPWLINVLRIDLQRARLKVVHALDEGIGLETVSSLAHRHQATAATNGGYFRLTGPYRGESIGLLLLNGQLISEPNHERAAFGLIEDGKTTELIFGHLKFSGEISIGGAKRSVQGVNRPLEPNDLIVFTPSFHRTTLTKPDCIEVVVRGNRVTAVNDLKGSSEIPADGYIISAVGQSREWIKRQARRGDSVSFTWRFETRGR